MLSQNDRKTLFDKKLYSACLDKNCSAELMAVIKKCSKGNLPFSTSIVEILNDLFKINILRLDFSFFIQKILNC